MEKASSSSADKKATTVHPHFSDLQLSYVHSLKIFDGEKIKVAANIIKNHDFSHGLDSWKPIEGHGYVAQSPSGAYAVLTKRIKWCSKLRQDITSSVTPGLPYTVSAIAAVSGSFTGTSEIHATVHLENHDSSNSYLVLAKVHVVKDEWKLIQGTFVLESLPKRVNFYLEGPNPGLDLLIKSIVICPIVSLTDQIQTNENVIINHQFDDGLNEWSGLGCSITLSRNDLVSDRVFAATKGRTEKWNGIEQDITGRVQSKLVYEASAVVRIYGNNVSSANVMVKLRMKAPNTRERYVEIASVQATDSDWIQLQGKFLINGLQRKVVIYIEGPPPGTDILVRSLVVKLAETTPVLPPPSIKESCYGVNIIKNSELNNGTDGWVPNGECELSVEDGSPSITPPLAKQSLGDKPLSGRYILVADRLQSLTGLAQIITHKVKLFTTYQVSAWVKISSSEEESVNVGLSLDNHWVNLSKVDTPSNRWHEVGGSFRIEEKYSKVMVVVNGPSSGVDLMVAGLQVFAVDREKRFGQLRKLADKIRKRDVVLKFTGDKLIGSYVNVKQVTNSFPIGSWIDRKSVENEDYLDFFVNNFNWATFRELKSHEVDEMIKLCQENKMQLTGRCNVWEKESAEKPWADILTNDELIPLVQARLELLLTRYKGKFKNFDINNSIPYRLGDELTIADLFKTAEIQDPNAALFINDCITRETTPKRYMKQISKLQEKGARVGGIGISGDMGGTVGVILGSRFDKLGVLGLPIWITGLSVSSVNEHVRADDLEVVLREAFAHPSVEGVMLSGFWEKAVAKENSHLVNAEGVVNEAGKRLIKIKEEWMSDTCGVVDKQGEFGFRGFHGSYEIEVVSNGKKVTRKFVVDKADDYAVLEVNINI